MKIFTFIFLLSLLGACQIKVKEIPAPENLLPKDSLIIVLEELMIVEQHIQSRYPQLNQFQDLAKRSGDTILFKYHVSFKRFDQAMDYYGSRQDEMKGIYEKILDNLNRKYNKL